MNDDLIFNFKFFGLFVFAFSLGLIFCSNFVWAWTPPPNVNGQPFNGITNIIITNPDSNSIAFGSVYNFSLGANVYADGSIGNMVFVNNNVNNIRFWDGVSGNWLNASIIGNVLDFTQQTSMNTINSLIIYIRLDFTLAGSANSGNQISFVTYPLDDKTFNAIMGEAPQLTPSGQGGYGAFDNLANVMGFYQGFEGTPVSIPFWDIGGATTINNGFDLPASSGQVSTLLTHNTFTPNSGNVLDILGWGDGAGAITNSCLGYSDTGGLQGQCFETSGGVQVDRAGSTNGALHPPNSKFIIYGINYQSSSTSIFQYNYGAWDRINDGFASRALGMATWNANSQHYKGYWIGLRNYYYVLPTLNIQSFSSTTSTSTTTTTSSSTTTISSSGTNIIVSSGNDNVDNIFLALVGFGLLFLSYLERRQEKDRILSLSVIFFVSGLGFILAGFFIDPAITAISSQTNNGITNSTLLWSANPNSSSPVAYAGWGFGFLCLAIILIFVIKIYQNFTEGRT